MKPETGEQKSGTATQQNAAPIGGPISNRFPVFAPDFVRNLPVPSRFNYISTSLKNLWNRMTEPNGDKTTSAQKRLGTIAAVALGVIAALTFFISIPIIILATNSGYNAEIARITEINKANSEKSKTNIVTYTSFERASKNE
ncbi:MAG: hypothetical protein V4490_02410, partial [Pseudomonadota bacterium]